MTMRIPRLPLVAALLSIALLLASGWLSAASAAARVYYFSTSGSDRNDGLSETAPLRDLGRIPGLLAPGVTVLLKRGDVWREPSLVWDLGRLEGTTALPIRIGAYGDADAAAPVIERPAGDAANGEPLLHADGVHHLMVEQLEIRGPEGWRAARIEPGSSDIVFESVTLARIARAPAEPLAAQSGTTYYFASDGNDSNSGRHPDFPKKSLRIVTDSLFLQPGATILLKRGSVWHDPTFSWGWPEKWGGGNWSFSYPGCAPMVIGAYGTGPRPVIAKMVRDDYATWQVVDAPNGIFRKQQAFLSTAGVPDNSDHVWRLYVGGQPLPKVVNQQALVDGSYCVEAATGYIYVRSTSFVAGMYVESIQREFAAGQSWGNLVSATDIHNLTIQDLEIRGGDTWSAIRIDAPSTGVTFRNLYLHDFFRYGITFRTHPSAASDPTYDGNCVPGNSYSDLTHAGVLVEGCQIDKGWSDAMNWEYRHTVDGQTNGAAGEMPAGDGVSFGTVDNGTVRNCTITNMGHTAVGAGAPHWAGHGVLHLLIEGNDLSAGTSSYCRAFALGGSGAKSNDIKIRRNYFHDLNVMSQLAGQDIEIYANVFDVHTRQASQSPGLRILPATYEFWSGGNVDCMPFEVRDVVIANNTFWDMWWRLSYKDSTWPSEALTVGGLSNIRILNNAFTGWRNTNDPAVIGSEHAGAVVMLPQFEDAARIRYDKNVFWRDLGYPAGQTIFTRLSTPTVGYDMAGANALPWFQNNREEDPRFVGGTGPTAFVLDPGSHAVCGGLSLSALVPGAVDFNGVPFDTLSPSIGAFQAPAGLIRLYDTNGTELFDHAESATNIRIVLPGPGVSTVYGPDMVLMPLPCGESWLTEEGSYFAENSFGQLEFVIDKTAPVVSGVTNNGLYNTDVVLTYDEGTGRIDGNYLPSGGTVSANGAHTFVVTDGAGNATTVSFTIDKIAPVVTSPQEGITYTANVNVVFDDGTATLNGAAITSGTTVSTNGSYTLVVTDAAGNVTTVHFTLAKPVLTDTKVATAVTVLKGSITSGTAANLAASDNSRMTVTAGATGNNRWTDWYGEATLAHTALSLTVTYEGNYSVSRTQTLFLWNWSTSAWVQVDSWTVGTTDVVRSYTTSSPAAYVSPTGVVRCRVLGSTRTSSYTCRADYLGFQYGYMN